MFFQNYNSHLIGRAELVTPNQEFYAKIRGHLQLETFEKLKCKGPHLIRIVYSESSLRPAHWSRKEPESFPHEFNGNIWWIPNICITSNASYIKLPKNPVEAQKEKREAGSTPMEEETERCLIFRLKTFPKRSIETVFLFLLLLSCFNKQVLQNVLCNTQLKRLIYEKKNMFFLWVWTKYAMCEKGEILWIVYSGLVAEQTNRQRWYLCQLSCR